MTKEKLTIPAPEQDRMEREVTRILASNPHKKESLPSFLYRLYQAVGIRRLLPLQLNELLLITAVGLVLLYVSMMPVRQSMTFDVEVYGLLFLLAPLFYAALAVYYIADKHHHGTFELEMVCKYTVYQMTAVRLIVLSALAILLNTVQIMLLAISYSDISFLRGITLSTASLFLFSVLFLFSCMKRPTAVRAGIVVGGWIAVFTLLSYAGPALHSYLLMQLPIAVYIVVLLISACLYAFALRRLLVTIPNEEVHFYVNRT